MGQAPSGESYNTNGKGLPLIAGAGDFGDLYPASKKYTTEASKVCERGDVVLGIRATIGEKVIADGRYCLGRGVAGLRPRSGLDGRYLWHWLTHINPLLVSKARGATFLQVNRSDIGDLPIALPSRPEQNRIAAILDKADALRTKRRETLAQLDRLQQSIFVDMFGDPVSNPRGWSRQALGDVLSSIDSGWSPVCLDRPVEGDEWGVLKLGAVTSCVYDQRANKALPPGVEPDARIEVMQGDLLFSRKNTYELVAACAYVEFTRPRLMMSDLIFRLQVRDENQVNKRFLHALLTNPRKRTEVQKLAGGSAGSMPNISKGKLLGMQVELPPIALQEEFASRLERTVRIKAKNESAAIDADLLFSSLQHRAFKGEL